MKTIYNSIKDDVVRHQKIQDSVLGKVTEWKRSHYMILSEIIRDELAVSEALKDGKRFELGNTISHITLQRFFSNNYQDKTHNDLRFLKTLDKICIFLGFKDLNSYIQHIKENEEHDKEADIELFSSDIIYKYGAAAFDLYKNFPALQLDVFKDLVFDKSPLLERVSQFSRELSERKFKLVTKNNRSNFEIFDVNILTDEPDKKILETHEFWNLLFKVGDTGEENFVNQLNTQVYFIRKIDNVWKIWDNYNPDAGRLNNKSRN